MLAENKKENSSEGVAGTADHQAGRAREAALKGSLRRGQVVSGTAEKDGRGGFLKAGVWTGAVCRVSDRRDAVGICCQDASREGQVERLQLRLDEQVVAETGPGLLGFARSHGQQPHLQVHVQPRRHLQREACLTTVGLETGRRRRRRRESLPARECRARGRLSSGEAV